MSSRNSWFGFGGFTSAQGENTERATTTTTATPSSTEASKPVLQPLVEDNKVVDDGAECEETASVTSEALSATETLIDASTAIPIPANSKRDQHAHEESKSRASSFRSWWSSSMGRSPTATARGSSVSMPSTPISTTHGDGSGAPPHNGDNKATVSRRVRKSGSHSSISAYSGHDSLQRLSRTNDDLPEDGQPMMRQRSSQASLGGPPRTSSELSRQDQSRPQERFSSSHTHSSSRSSWWRLVGVRESNEVDEAPIVSSPTSAQSEQETLREDADRRVPRPMDKTIENRDNSASTTDDNKPANDTQPIRKNGSFTDVRRWSFFSTWSSPSDLLDSGSEAKQGAAPAPSLSNSSNKGTKQPEMIQRLSTQQRQSTTQLASAPPSPPPSPLQSSTNMSRSPSRSSTSSEASSASAPAQSSLLDSDATKNEKLTESDGERPKLRSRRHSRCPSNPIVQTLPQNRSSWLHFFTVTAPKAVAPARVENTQEQPRLITDSSKQIPQAVEEKSLITATAVEQTKPVESAATLLKMGVKPVPLNMVLPSFDELPLFRSMKRPTSVVQQTLHAINSYFFPSDNPPRAKLPRWLDEITRSSIDVKRVAIIGVHGWFMAKMFRAVWGEPTGTSPKFCEMMGKAVVGYLAQHGITLAPDAVSLIPLEGEGKVETRVDVLYQIFLRNNAYRDALANADVVFVATHSQGTPVSTMLLARLILQNHVQPRRQRICMLAMAGISHGPFPSLKKVARFGGDAQELFEFMDFDTMVARKYRQALKTVVDAGVKIVYVASMDDQVVPVYSALFNGVSHPSILRAIYIDAPLYQDSDFLINLILFAVRLRNHGISDHGLLVHLSEVVAGSLISEGHSTLYEEIGVYTLAVRYLFETSSPDLEEVRVSQFQAQQRYNPFALPWAMRGIVEDKQVLTSDYLLREMRKLQQQFDEWDPVSKAMKDIKFRLEPWRDPILGRAKL